MRKGEMLNKALMIMILAHEGQYDKGGKPYSLHPLTVLHKLKTDDEEVQCAAVLHDVIEDCSGKTIYLNGRPCVISFQMLSEEGMSPRVVDTVRRLTKMPGQTYEQYQAEVLSSIGAMMVKREDLRTNSDLRRLKSRAITEKDVARVAKYMAFYTLIESKLAENG